MATANDFWTRVVKGTESQCWPWKKALFHGGHGAVIFEGRQDRAHRVAWILVRGPIPPGMCVLHKCDNPPCCNPSHLFLGTRSDNIADRHAKGRDARGARSGRRTKPFSTAGESNGRAKLTRKCVQEIKILRSNGLTLSQLAASYGVGISAIHRIVSGKGWI